MALGVYIHIPFCVQKCKYCDFNSHVSDPAERERYIAALCREIESCDIDEDTVDTVYFGGGTPTILEARQLVEILDAVRKRFVLTSDCEITTECNPATMRYDGFVKLRSAGFNRISMGMQTANDDELKILGRIHSVEDCRICVDNVKKAGFENISVDLMMGLPGQTTDSLKKSLKAVTEMNVTHISCYGLRVEEGTPFYDMNVTVDDELCRDMYDECVEYLSGEGFNVYEISNFAKSGFESRHNLKYWRCEDFVGFGAGAYSCVNNVRYSNIRSTKEYMEQRKKQDTVERVILSREDMMSEFVFLGLRTADGISEEEFKRRFGDSIRHVYGREIEKNLKRGTLISENGNLKIPIKYFYVSNSIMVDFV